MMWFVVIFAILRGVHGTCLTVLLPATILIEPNGAGSAIMDPVHINAAKQKTLMPLATGIATRCLLPGMSGQAMLRS
jgi:hypothetical protein